MSGVRNYMDLMQDYCISSLRCNEGIITFGCRRKTEPHFRKRRYGSESDIRQAEFQCVSDFANCSFSEASASGVMRAIFMI